jgi:tRNA pseudouridine55 synthase
VNGFFCIDKPIGISSFAVVKKLRKACPGRCGHNGTLDPLASGLLICAVGQATRLLEWLPGEPKTYQFAVTFGRTTDTLDSEGAVTASGGPIPSAEAIATALPEFLGTQLQLPPRYSAKKINGTAAYHLARRNEEFTLVKREITVYSLNLTGFDAQAGEARLTVQCSGGTYVRSLARDLGEKLGTYGFASAIRRTAIGRFSVAQALTPEQIDTDLAGHLIPPLEAFDGIPRATVSPAQVASLACGRDIEVAGAAQTNGPLCLVSEDHQLIAIAEPQGSDRVHPTKVFVTPCK